MRTPPYFYESCSLHSYTLACNFSKRTFSNTAMDDDSNDSCSESRIPYFRLLNTLANDLDYMLNDLYTTPPSTLRMSGDAFLEPYMQGLSNDIHHATAFDDVSNENCNVLKKRLQEEYLGNDDRASSISSPVTSLDTPLDERTEPHFGLLAGSQGSLNQLICEDDCSDSGSENSSLVGDEETKCDITLVERLIRSHPIWFLPGILRAGAFHLLQGKEDGNFVVRKSSQSSTMAISVRLPAGKGPYIEHYLIQVYEDGQFGLESSDNKFPTIPLLIAYYCQCCDELPVQLTLPRAIREAKNRQKLTSLALLGQEFWRYPMANPGQSFKLENESPVSLPSMSVRDSNPPISNTPFSNSSSSNSPASSFSSSSFESNSSIPLEESSPPLSNSKSTFKGSPSFSSMPYNEIGIPVTPESPSSLPVESSQSQIINVRQRRPTPPNSLNLACTTSSTIVKTENNRADSNSPSLIQLVTPSSKTPPPPPPRWTKPPIVNSTSSSSNFTVTTTLTLSVNKETHSSSSDPKTTSSQLSSSERTEKQVIQAKTLASSLPAIAPVPLPRLHIPAVTSPTSPSTVSESNRPFRRHRRTRESSHYQESDVTYHSSPLADKASDYEDIWGPDNVNFSTFKPQPPPRSLPFSSLDDFSTKNVSKKCLTSAAGSSSPQTDTLESPPPTSLVSPVSLPDMPTNGSLLSKHRFGPVFSGNGADPPSSISPSVPASVPSATPAVVEPQTPVQSASTPVEPKTGSPFYAEPADAIKQAAAFRRRIKPAGSNSSQGLARNRHSDPTLLHQWPTSIADGGMLERIDSKEELITSNGSFSTSVDNLVTFPNSRRKSGGNPAAVKNVKPIDVPKVVPAKGKSGNEIWAVDSSWEFFGKEMDEEDDITSGSPKNICDNDELKTEDSKSNCENSNERILTVQEMIFQRLPSLRLSPVFNSSLSTEISGKNTETDDLNCSNASTNHTNDSNNNSSNSEKIYHNGLSVLSQISDTSDTQTEFSEPWDCSQWEHLLNDESHAQVNRCKSFKERLDPLLSPPRLKALSRTREENSTPGATVRTYALKLAADKDTVFAKAIENFIACTKESRETRPQVVMRNMRQFMSGMKNYLVTHGEREFNKEVENERNRLKSTEFLNLDAILEGVMHKLVVTPLKHHLCDLFVKAFEENGAIKALGENIVYARTKTPHDLGLKRKLELPTSEDLQEIASLFHELQAADSPLVKLECLLKAISNIFNSVKRYNPVLNGGLGADDFLPIFVWVLVQTGLVSAEIEAEYMWGLLHPSLLSGEGGYYLTTLSSAVDVLKNFRHFSNNDNVNETPQEPWAFTHVFKVLIPNELNGSLLTKTLPLRPNMTTREICRIIALKLRITNPQDYALYQLVEGEESPLNDGDYPQDVKTKLVQKGKRCLFAYKRIDAKIAWPN